jgi:hypothetical protein
MTKYRLKEFDLVNDIWIIQQRTLFFFWVGQFAITGKEKAQSTIKQLNSK